MPKVSVVIPTYNMACYLPEAIESVLAQTYQQLEIIVVDDGSTDNTEEVVAPYRDRILLLRKPHAGPNSARNLAIRKCAAPYVAFLDADDIWYPDKLERQLEVFATSPEYDLVHSDGLITATDNSQEDRLWFSAKRCVSAGRVFRNLLEECFIILSSVIVKRDCLLETELFDEDLERWGGYDLWLRVAFKSQIGFVDAPLFLRRLHQNNLFYSDLYLEIVSIIKTMEKWEKQGDKLSQPERTIVRNNLRNEHFRLGVYHLSHGQMAEARSALVSSLAHGFSRRSFSYLLLSMLPRNVVLSIKRVRHHFGFGWRRQRRI